MCLKCGYPIHSKDPSDLCWCPIPWVATWLETLKKRWPAR